MKPKRNVSNILIPMTAMILFLLFIFLLDPVRVTGWVLNPIHKMHAEKYLNALAKQDYAAAAEALDEKYRSRTEWIEQMNRLKSSGVTFVRYEGFRVPHDRERMDGRAAVTFLVGDKEVVQTIILNMSVRGVTQACSHVYNNSNVLEPWNAVNCEPVRSIRS